MAKTPMLCVRILHNERFAADAPGVSAAKVWLDCRCNTRSRSMGKDYERES
ncbi:MAG: hypothetical protein K8L97_33850 [Anaerolineae bacterium]|nr:hypothetical protein [Anaerolineae bacterium]